MLFATGYRLIAVGSRLWSTVDLCRPFRFRDRVAVGLRLTNIQDSVVFNLLLDHSTVLTISTSTKICAEKIVGLSVPTAVSTAALSLKRKSQLKL